MYQFILEGLMKMNLVSVILAIVISIFYCQFVIKYHLGKKLPAPNEAFMIVGWANAVIGAMISSELNMTVGLVVLYYKFVVLPYKFIKGPVA